MSKWNEYGFPDNLVGVPFQIALEGLVCALMERAKVYNAQQYASPILFDISEGDKIYCHPIFNVLRAFDGFSPNLSFYDLPNGKYFTLENAAEYLKEDLIRLDAGIGESWSYATTSQTYEWCMQRYRFINLLWKTRPNVYQFPVGVSEICSGSGETFSEAKNELEQTDFTTGLNYIKFRITTTTVRSGNYWGVDRWSSIPYQVRYDLHVPGVIVLEITPRMYRGNVGANLGVPEDALEYTVIQGDSSYQWRADDFGCGLKFNTRQVLFTKPIPAGTPPGTVVELDGLGERLYSYAKVASFHEPSSGYDYSVIYLGFETWIDCYTDFRQTFQFYDEIKVE